MDRRIELLAELGKYSAINIDDIDSELNYLQKLGYNCYYDHNSDQIVWEDFVKKED